jgi:DUF438 domain-containing protein
VQSMAFERVKFFNECMRIFFRWNKTVGGKF